MPASIFNGTAVKLLKNILRFRGGVEVITNDTDNPTVVAKDAPQGSLYVQSGTGTVYLKLDNGSSTNWTQVITDSVAQTLYANQALNNLSSTSINQNLLPSATNTRNFGSTTFRWADSFLRSVAIGATSTQLNLTEAGITQQAAAASNLTISTGGVSGANSSKNISVLSGSAAGSGDSGGIQIQTGSSGSGASGNIELATSGAPTRGIISLNAEYVTANNTLIRDVLSPELSTDVATKEYVDALAQGAKAKEAVLVATTANITLSGEQTIDGVLTNASRVLVKNQTSTQDNGIYVSSAGAWTRSTDFDSVTPIDEITGALVSVRQGTTQQGQVWVCNSTVTTLGTDPVTFVYFNSIATLNAGNGLSLTGTTLDVDHDGEGLTFVSTQLALELDGTTLSKSATGLKVADLGIANAQVSASAAIDYSKLNLANSIVNADIATGAAIAYAKLDLASSIVNSDISASAAVDFDKMETLTVDRALITNSSGIVDVSATTSAELAFLSGVTSSIQTQLDSKLGVGVSSQSASFTAAKSTNYLVDSSGGAVLITLPSALGGGWIRIIDSAGAAETNAITLDGAGAETVNGSATYVIESNRQSVLLLSTGSAWVIA